MVYGIVNPNGGQNVSASQFGQRVKAAIDDLDLRVASVEGNQQRIVKRGRRLVSSGNFTTTETPILRVDDIPVLAGSIYRIATSSVNVDTSVAHDVVSARFRVQFSASPGTPATVSSTLIDIVRNAIDDIAQSNAVPGHCFYIATTTGYISVLLSAQRVAGTGTLFWQCSSTEPLDLTVEYGGDDPGDTGVVL